MSQIPASLRDLTNAFHCHSSNINNCTSFSKNLLLFYCVECGLKMVYLKYNGLKSTDQFNDNAKNLGHDIKGWIKELHLSAETANGFADFHLKNKPLSFSIKEAHQAWRYGIPLNSEDENSIIQGLDKVRIWIEENR